MSFHFAYDISFCFNHNFPAMPACTMLLQKRVNVRLLRSRMEKDAMMGRIGMCLFLVDSGNLFPVCKAKYGLGLSCISHSLLSIVLNSTTGDKCTDGACAGTLDCPSDACNDGKCNATFECYLEPISDNIDQSGCNPTNPWYVSILHLCRFLSRLFCPPSL